MSDTATAPAPAALVRKLDELARRHAELEASLNDQAILTNPQKLVSVSKEKGKLDPVVQRYRDYLKARDAAAELRELSANKADADMAELAAAEAVVPELLGSACQTVAAQPETDLLHAVSGDEETRHQPEDQ